VVIDKHATEYNRWTQAMKTKAKKLILRLEEMSFDEVKALLVPDVTGDSILKSLGFPELIVADAAKSVLTFATAAAAAPATITTDEKKEKKEAPAPAPAAIATEKKKQKEEKEDEKEEPPAVEGELATRIWPSPFIAWRAITKKQGGRKVTCAVVVDTGAGIAKAKVCHPLFSVSPPPFPPVL
jgi:hypothetical protein